MPPFGGRGGFVPPFAPQFPGGMPQFHGGGPQFPGGAHQFAGRGGFPSLIPVPFTPANGGTFPSARPKPGTPGGAPVAASSKAEWDAWNARYPQHGKQVNR